MFGHQLAVIFIRRHHVHLEAFLLRLFGHGADHIVRLVAGYFQNRNIVSLYDFFNDRDGLTDHFRRTSSRCALYCSKASWRKVGPFGSKATAI